MFTEALTRRWLCPCSGGQFLAPVIGTPRASLRSQLLLAIPRWIPNPGAQALDLLSQMLVCPDVGAAVLHHGPMDALVLHVCV